MPRFRYLVRLDDVLVRDDTDLFLRLHLLGVCVLAGIRGIHKANTNSSRRKYVCSPNWHLCFQHFGLRTIAWSLFQHFLRRYLRKYNEDVVSDVHTACVFVYASTIFMAASNES